MREDKTCDKELKISEEVRTLVSAIKSLDEWLSKFYDEKLLEFGVNHDQALILWQCHKKALSQTKLCKIIGADKNHIRLLINDLKQKGLIDKLINPKDRRERLIILTKLGKERVELSFEFVEKRLLERINETQKQKLHNFLFQIYEALMQMKKERMKKA